MTEEPTTGPDGAEYSTDLVMPARRPVAVPARRWPEVTVLVRRHLAELRRNPTAMAAIATVGSAVVTAGLRHAATLPAVRRSGPVTVRGHVVHEVHVIHHVIHHVVHHVIRPPAGRPPGP